MAAKEGMNIPKDVLDSLPFDPVALKQKYLEERDKRLRKDGNNQYIMCVRARCLPFLVPPASRATFGC